MEHFKAILRHAVQSKCERLLLEQGKPPILTIRGSNSPWTKSGTLDASFFPPILKFLFANEMDAIKTGQPVKGVLKIPGIGEVKLIGHQGKIIRLFLYFQEGSQYDDDWARLRPADDLPQKATAKKAPPAGKTPDMPDIPTPPPGAGQRSPSPATVPKGPPALSRHDHDSSFDEIPDPGTFVALQHAQPEPEDRDQDDDDQPGLPPLGLSTPTAESESADDDDDNQVDKSMQGLAVNFESDEHGSDTSVGDYMPGEGLGLSEVEEEVEEEPQEETDSGQDQLFKLQLNQDDDQEQSQVESDDVEDDVDLSHVPNGSNPGDTFLPEPSQTHQEVGELHAPAPANNNLGDLLHISEPGEDYQPQPPSPRHLPKQDFAFENQAPRPSKPQGHPGFSSVVSPAAEPELSANIDYGPIGIGENPKAENADFAIDMLLKTMIEKGASDLHLAIGQPAIFRIDGDIARQEGNPLTPEAMANLLDPIIPLPNKRQFVDSCDTDFAHEIAGVGRFRVNIFRNRFGVAAVLRHIPSTILTAEKLGLPRSILQFCELSKGLVVVTGPTGSGKSTTLAAMIDRINHSRAEHILTIEDPVEFVHQPAKCLVNQREVHRHTKSFSQALRAALREDPDIILIGEMRDLETIAIAIETAETGHLVFGTLHTNTAVSTIDRIIDQFPPKQQAQIRSMLASSLKGVIAQTLVKRKGGGRAAAHEILVLNDAVSAMIREAKNHMIQNHMVTQKNDGNALLNESLVRLVLDNTVTLEDAYIKSVDKKGFIEIGRRQGLPVQNLELNPKRSAS